LIHLVASVTIETVTINGSGSRLHRLADAMSRPRKDRFGPIRPQFTRPAKGVTAGG
jgi:hypothetical protein